MKPTNLSIVQIPPVDIGLTVINKLEIDLSHVNHGIDKETKIYNKRPRSNFSEVEVANIFSFLDGILLAFCIDQNTIQTAGIITFYKIKK